MNKSLSQCYTAIQQQIPSISPIGLHYHSGPCCTAAMKNVYISIYICTLMQRNIVQENRIIKRTLSRGNLKSMSHETIAYTENFTKKQTVSSKLFMILSCYHPKLLGKRPIQIFKENRTVYTYFKERFTERSFNLVKFG